MAMRLLLLSFRPPGRSKAFSLFTALLVGASACSSDSSQLAGDAGPTNDSPSNGLDASADVARDATGDDAAHVGSDGSPPDSPTESGGLDASTDVGDDTSDGVAQDAPPDVADATGDGDDGGCSNGNSVTVLASGLGIPVELAVDSTNVYWTNIAANVQKCAIGGCNNSPAALAAVGASADHIAVDKTNVYWTEVGGDTILLDCPTAGCPNPNQPTQLANGLGSLNGIAVDAVNVYWSDSFDNTIYECATGGCNDMPMPVVASLLTTPGAIAAGGGYVYWVNTGDGVVACPTTGICQQPTTIATGGQSPLALAVDANNVYWTDTATNTVARCAISGCGNSPTVLAAGLASPNQIATDSVNVYWTNYNDGTVMKCAVGGCGAPTVVACGQTSPGSIVVDSTSAYWIDKGMGGRVSKAAK
jgi:hypothetical protein